MMNSSDNKTESDASSREGETTSSAKRVYVIAGESQILYGIPFRLEQAGYVVRNYESTDHFLAQSFGLFPGIVVTDQTRALSSGVEVRRDLFESPNRFRIVVLTAFPNTGLTVAAMKSGAVSVISPPFEMRELIEAIEDGFRQIAVYGMPSSTAVRNSERLSLLSPRELEVIQLVYEGLTNKSISIRLGISIKTVERHRSKAMHKLQVSSLAELIRMISRR